MSKQATRVQAAFEIKLRTWGNLEEKEKKKGEKRRKNSVSVPSH